MTAKIKLTVSLPDDAMDAIEEISKTHQITKTAALVRAIATYRFLIRRSKEGQKVLIRDEARDSYSEVLL